MWDNYINGKATLTVGNTCHEQKQNLWSQNPLGECYFISVFLHYALLQENCNTGSMGPASLRLSQPSAQPDCSHHLWGQDSSHQCQRGRCIKQDSHRWPRCHAEPLVPAPPLAESQPLLREPSADVRNRRKIHIISAEPYKCYKLHPLIAKPAGRAPEYPKTTLNWCCSTCLTLTSDNSHLFKKIQS